MADAVVGRIKAVVTADATGLTTGLDRAQAKLQSFSDGALRVGRTMTTRLTVPLVAAGAAAVKTASQFESSMSKITALVGVAENEVKAMEGTVRSMAVQFGKSGKEAADALFFITSAGLRGATATETLGASLRASAIGLGDTATIADLATSALNAYGADALSASEATDVMTAAVREGKLEASELAGSMGRVLPLASAMGVEFNEVGAAFAALSRTGTNAAEAATQIRGILSSLLRPTKQAEDALTGMGLSAEGLREQIREQGLLAVLKTLAERFEGNEAAAAAVFGNIRALSGVLDLMGANVATTEAIFASMENTTGAVDEAFAVMSQTASFQFAQAMAEVRESLLTLGQAIMPSVSAALEVLVGVVRNVTEFFSGLDSGTKNLIVALGGVLAVAGPATLAIGALTAAVGALGVAAAPVTIAIGALAAVGALWFAGAMDARQRTNELTAELADLDDQLVTTVPRFQQLVDTVAQTLPSTPIETLTDEMSRFAGQATLDAALIESGLSDMFDSVGFNIEELGAQLRSGSGSFDAFQQAFEDGEQRMRNFSSELAITTNEVTSLETEVEFLQGTIETQLGRALTDSEQKLFDFATANGVSSRSVEDLIDQLSTLENTFKDVRNENEQAARTAVLSSDNLAVLNKLYAGNARNVIEAFRQQAELNDRTDEYTFVAEQLADVMEEVATEHAFAAAETARFQRAVDASRNATGSAVPSLETFASALVDAGNMAGFDIQQIAGLVDGLNVLDALSPEVRVKLGLDVLGGDAILDLIDQLISLELGTASDLPIGDGLEFGFGGGATDSALGGLLALRNSLADALENPTATSGGGGGGGGSGASNALDEVARAAEEAQRQTNQLAQSVAKLGNSLMSYDFRDELFGADPEELVDIFGDLAREMHDLGMAGSDIANLGAKFKAAVSAAEELEQATTDLNKAQDHLNGLLRDRDALKSSVTDMFKPQLSGDVNVMAQTQRLLQQARTFRDNIIALRDKGFPADVIGEVVNAGLIGGAKLSSQLLRMGTGEFEDFLRMRSEIARIGEQSGRLVAQITFGADIDEAEATVNNLTAALEAATEQMQTLVTNIQVDLYNTFNDFLTNLGGEITALTASPFDLNFDDSAITKLTTLIAQITGEQITKPKPGDNSKAPIPKSPITPPVTPVQPTPTPSTYTVKKGDSLWGIATALLGNGVRWREIATFNGKDPDKYGASWGIHPGDVLKIPMLAMGGRARRNMPHLVGEMGAELFVPDSSGYVVPNHMLGGGGNQTVNVTINTHSGMRAEDIVREIEKYTRRRGQVSIPTISTRRR